MVKLKVATPTPTLTGQTHSIDQLVKRRVSTQISNDNAAVGM